MLSSGSLFHGMCIADPVGFPLLQEVVKPLAETVQYHISLVFVWWGW